ncbi:MAG: hypothetical protein QOK42_1799 [Frankiaceae bacterium]|nr:hypothetical protein [Frankiaceae bacterium]
MTVTVEALLPVYSRREVHRRNYAATASEVRAVLEGLRPRDLPLTRALFAVRGLPLLLQGKSPFALVDLDRGGSLLEQTERAGFLRVVDNPTELVLVAIGRFWRPDGARVQVSDREDFERFDQPGYAKAVWSFELNEQGTGTTELVTETRVLATDAGAARLLAAYWLLIRAGSGLIRREMLAAVATKLR